MGLSKKLSEDLPKRTDRERPLQDIMQETELTKDNCSPEAWEQIGGKATEDDDDKDLPF